MHMRCVVVLPHGTGTDTGVAVLVEDEAAKAACAAKERLLQAFHAWRVRNMLLPLHDLFLWRN